MDYKDLAKKHGGAPAGDVDFADIARRFGGRTQAFQEGAREAPGALQGLISVVQGPTFGFGDEIAGALAAPLKSAVTGQPVGEAYREVRDYMRGAAQSQDEQNPFTTLATRSMAAAPTMAFGKAQQAAGMMSGMAASAKAGGVTGAISGLGNSTATSPVDMALDAAKGGVLGASLGALAVPVASGMGSMKDNVLSRFNDSAAMRYAKQKVAEAMVRDARGSTVRANPSASFGQVASKFEKLGDEARVVDAAGQNTRQLLDTLSTLPGQTKEATERAILSRQAGRADRLRTAAQSSLGQDGARLLTTIDNLVEERSRAAAPLYDSLYKSGVFINDELRGIIDAANKLGAGSEAKRIAIAKQRDYSLTPDTKWAGMRDLDYLKQGLDDLIAANKTDTGKLTKVGAAVQGLKADLVQILDQETRGAYKAARNAFAGPSALIDAAKEGRAALSRDDTQIAKALSGLTSGEQEAFRLGAYEALRAKLGNMSGQNEILRLWRDKTTAEKLKAIFGDERSFREFAARASAENRMKGLESVGRGSQTASRQYGAGDMDVPAIAETVQSLSGATGVPGFLSAVGRNWNRIQTPEPVRDAMGRMLLSQGAAGRNTISDIEDAVRLIAMHKGRAANALGVGLGNAPTNALATILPMPR